MLQRLKLCFQTNLTNTSYPIQADTLFGHICWAIQDLEGTEALEQFLMAYDNNTPPLLLSDGWPANYWPRPKLKPLPRTKLRAILKTMGVVMDSREGMALWQNLKQVESLTWAEWEQLMTHGTINEEQLLRLLATRKFVPQPGENIVDLPHNTIDRLTNRPVLEGGYFHSQEYTFTPQSAGFDLYLRLDHALMSEERCYRLLKYVGLIGFGKDKSTGKGAFTVNLPQAWEHLALPHTGNRVMSLSVGIPGPQLTHGYYTLIPKYGRLGGHWATESQPYKRPLLMHTAGSTYTPTGPIQPYYGSLLKNVHHRLSKVRHYAYLLVWPFQEE
jgi:CRISPR-associated protein Csm4